MATGQTLGKNVIIPLVTEGYVAPLQILFESLGIITVPNFEKKSVVLVGENIERAGELIPLKVLKLPASKIGGRIIRVKTATPTSLRDKFVSIQPIGVDAARTEFLSVNGILLSTKSIS